MAARGGRLGAAWNGPSSSSSSNGDGGGAGGNSDVSSLKNSQAQQPTHNGSAAAPAAASSGSGGAYGSSWFPRAKSTSVASGSCRAAVASAALDKAGEGTAARSRRSRTSESQGQDDDDDDGDGDGEGDGDGDGGLSTATGRSIAETVSEQESLARAAAAGGGGGGFAGGAAGGLGRGGGGRNAGASLSERVPSWRLRNLVEPFHATPADFVIASPTAAADRNPERLQRWRRRSLVLNSRRRFRYTADLSAASAAGTPCASSSSVFSDRPSKNLGTEDRSSHSLAEKIRLGQGNSEEAAAAARAKGFGVNAEQLQHLVEGHDQQNLVLYGGVAGVARALCVDAEQGIAGDEADVARRVHAFGTNTYPEKPPKMFFEFVWDAMQDFTLIILSVCAAVSLFVGILTEGWTEGWYDGAGILLSVLVVVVVTAVSDYKQSLQFAELDKEKKKVWASVVRRGERQRVSVYDIVVGDVVLLAIGDIIPTDGILIAGFSLVVDESSMTGESMPVRKHAGDTPFLLAGTKVQDGHGTYLATGVGMRTEWGHLMAKLSDSGDDETPLQVKLSGVATLVGRLGLYVALVVFAVLMLRLLVSIDYADAGWTSADSLKVVNFFAVAVTIVVVAVPEGLPLAVTLSLAFAMKKMMADKALVRKLAACETMGSATTICSDKTGTLTANQMTVVRAWLYSAVRPVLGDSVRLGVPQSCTNLLLEALFTNTTADVQEAKAGRSAGASTLTSSSSGVANSSSSSGGGGSISGDGGSSSSGISGSGAAPVILGSPTESALVSFGLRLGGRFQDVRAAAGELLRVEPFNSQRKRMGVALELPEYRGVRVHWKGAAEMVVGMCDKVLLPSGQVMPLKEGEVEPVLADFTSDALRTLAFAFADLEPKQLPESVRMGEGWSDEVPLPDSGMTLLAVVGIQDPLRPEVPAAVATCKHAGIKVRMVTGDNLKTAIAIARECGILTEGGEAIEGPAFRKLSPDEMHTLIPRLQVMARSSPSDKHTLVRELRGMGDVVAVTGDGTNDAPALGEADIGLAMGIAGTEVAKESADIVILDDNFSSIVNVAKWGRSVYTNIQKFVQFQLTVNIVALFTNFVSACFTGTAPLTAVQLLWVNLIMDTLGALALATEPPTERLMVLPPVGRYTPFITNVMWRNIFGQAVFQLLLLGTLQYGGVLGFDGRDAAVRLNTVIFNTFVFCQLFNEVNARDMEAMDVFSGILSNSIFMSILGFTFIVQVLMVQCLGKFASTVPLTLPQFALCVGLGALSLPLGALIKLIPVPAKSIMTDAMFDSFQPHPDDDEDGRGHGLQGHVPDLHVPLLAEAPTSRRQGVVQNYQGQPSSENDFKT